MAQERMIEGVEPIYEKLHGPVMSINQFRDLIAMLEHRYQNYGKIASRFFSFPEGVAGPLLLFGAEHNHLILSKPELFHHLHMDTFGDSDMRAIAQGLLFQNGEIHLAHRRLMMPAFHKKVIESYRDVMVAITEEFLQQWQFGSIRDLNHDMHQLTMQIVSRSLFGMKIGESSEEIGEIIVDAMRLGINPLNFILPFNRPPFPRYYAIRKFQELAASVRRLIEEKKSSKEESHDLLSLLIHAKDEDGLHLTDEELLGQANTLFIAGHETTANALVYILLLLSQHPEAMAKVGDELEFLDGDAPSLEQLNKLEYLDAVIKEGMRLFPPAALLGRLSQDEFEAGGFHFPKGTWVTISQYITQRMPEIFENPRRFVPERWASNQPSIYEYFPFGAGSRMCIGASFATMEMKLLLAILLQRYRLSLMPNSRINRNMTVTLGIKGRLAIMIEKQDKNYHASKTNFTGNVRNMLDWV